MFSYPALLALHLLVVIVFGGGLLLNAATLPGAPSATPTVRRRAAALNRWVTTPALVLVWVLGLALAVQGGWLAAGWLHAKIALVLALSALHGIVSARLRRGRPTGHWPFGIVLALIVGIVILVTAKPF